MYRTQFWTSPSNPKCMFFIISCRWAVNSLPYPLIIASCNNWDIGVSQQKFVLWPCTDNHDIHKEVLINWIWCLSLTTSQDGIIIWTIQGSHCIKLIDCFLDSEKKTSGKWITILCAVRTSNFSLQDAYHIVYIYVAYISTCMWDMNSPVSLTILLMNLMPLEKPQLIKDTFVFNLDVGIKPKKFFKDFKSICWLELFFKLFT